MNILEEFTLPSSYDGLALSCCLVKPEGEIKGVFQLVHGMTEHKERYLAFMQFLAQNGYASIIHDHRGHGASVKAPEDLGWFYEGGPDAVVEDILTVHTCLKEKFENAPCFLLGHSMGSLAVRCFATKYDDRIDGLIVMGTPAFNQAMGAGVAAARADALLHGKRHKSKALNQMAFGTYNARFKKEKHAFAWLNSDPAEVQKYEDDELCGFLFTDEGWLTLFGMMKICFDPEYYLCANPKLPVLFLSGSDDPCHVDRRHFYDAMHCMVNAGYRNVKGKLYPGMRHEILLEPDREQVYRNILTFAASAVKPQ